MTHAKNNRANRSVVVNDDILIVDISKAKTPGLVRLKLADLTFAHFHVRSSAEGSSLGFSTGRDEFVSLGLFADRGDADAVLRDIREEMLRIETYHRFFNLRTLWMVGGAAVVLWVILWFAAQVSVPRLPELADPLPAEDTFGEAPAPSIPPGTPVDADVKLTPPK